MSLFHRFIRHDEYMLVNPMYRTEFRLQERRSSATLTWAYLGILFGVMCIGHIIAWLGVITVRLSDSGRFYFFTREELIYSSSNEVVAWGFLLSVIFTMLLDIICVLVSVNMINVEIVNGNWDLVRLTNISRQQAIAAKHAIAQQRPWRLFTVVTTLRLAVFVLAIVQAYVILVPASVGSPNAGMTVIEGLTNDFRANPWLTLAEGGVIFLVMLTLLIEPLWRLRAVTAFGLLISAWVWRRNFAMLTGFAGVFAMWLCQGFLMLVYFWLMYVLLGISPENSDAANTARVLLIMIGFCICVYAYYRLLRAGVLRGALYGAFRYEH